MKSWLRIFLIFFALLGSTAFSGYWYMNEFNQVLDDLTASYVITTRPIYPTINRLDIDTQVASTTPEIEELATSTEELNDLTQTTTTDVIIEKFVTVLNTGTGYLNVRGGPGLQFKKEHQVDVGSVFKMLDEQGDWTKIEISTTTSGWVLTKYIEKQ